MSSLEYIYTKSAIANTIVLRMWCWVTVQRIIDTYRTKL